MKFKFLPKDTKFFQLFHTQASLILQASALLVEEAQASDGAREELAASIAHIESLGDNVTHELSNELNRAFITPLEPEDIHQLASNLDDVLDTIEDVAHRLYSYRPRTHAAEIIEMCRLTASCAAQIPLGLQALERRSSVAEVCDEIGRLEHQADHMIRQAIADLFRGDPDPVEAIKLREIYEFLELTADRCEDVADALENVTVKNN
jgi:uncharacterized protein